MAASHRSQRAMAFREDLGQLLKTKVTPRSANKYHEPTPGRLAASSYWEWGGEGNVATCAVMTLINKPQRKQNVQATGADVVFGWILTITAVDPEVAKFVHIFAHNGHNWCKCHCLSYLARISWNHHFYCVFRINGHITKRNCQWNTIFELSIILYSAWCVFLFSFFQWLQLNR